MAWPVLPHGFLGVSDQEDDPYKVSRSLRLDSSASARLNRTFVTPTTQNTFTLSLWTKLGVLGTIRHIFGVSTNHTFGFTAGDTLNLTFAGVSALTTTGVFRDPTAWYHIVWTQSGTSHTLYVNGVSVGTATATSSVFNTAVSHLLGASNTTTPANFYNGYFAEVHFVDGQALTPSSFAETSSATGRYRPKAYSGSYGLNGFYLSFQDNTSTTTLGFDDAGSNDWTLTNFSVAAYAANDSLVDSPTNYGTDTGVGGEVRGNYATLNPVSTVKGTIVDGNLKTNGGNLSSISTIGMSSGKWYAEMYVTTIGAESSLGVSRGLNSAAYVGASSDSWGYYSSGVKYNNAVSGAYGASYTTGDTIGVAFDADAGDLVFYKNGVSQGTAYTGLTNGPYFFMCSGRTTTAANDVTMNFGQQAWKHAPPSGYKALCTTNFSIPQVRKASTQIDSLAYAGDGTSKFLAASEFDVGLSWIKNRSAAGDHVVNDSFRNETSLLLNMDGADGSTTFTDSSSNAFSITNSNNVSVQTALGFNGAYFQGASSPSRALTLPTSNAFDFGALDWTIEFWYLKAGTPQADGRIIQTGNGDVYTAISLSFNGAGDNLRCLLSSDGVSWGLTLPGCGTVSSSAWRHFAVVRNGSTVSAYQDGVLQNFATSITSSLYFSGNETIVIGGQSSGPSRTVNGYIDNLRVVRGKALYTSAFTPPTRELGISASTSPSLSSNLSSNDSIGASYIGPSADSKKVYVTSALNASSNNYINWRWRSGTSAARNTSGTIPSFAKANTTGGLSIVSWIGTGSAGTIGHGLNATPAFIIAKQIGASTTGNAGAVYHKSLGATKYLKLFETTNGNAAETTDNTVWNGSSPTFSTTLFSVGTSTRTNNFTASPATYFPHIAYCFSEVPGFSMFGSYSGNAAADGPFVFLGFRPEVLIIKPSSATGNWSIIDTARDSVNVSARAMFADTNALEDTTRAVDILANGFKIRSSTILNASAVTHVFAAFAESPFKYSRAR